MKGINFVGCILLAIIAICSRLIINDAQGSSVKKMNIGINGEEIIDWQQLQSDGYELNLVNLPDYVVKKTIYIAKKERNMTIGRFALSSDYKKIAFTSGTFGNRDPSDNLYIYDLDTEKLSKIGYSLSLPINLRGFLIDNRLLLEGNLNKEEGIIIFHDKTADNSYLFSYDLLTGILDRFNDLGITTVGLANAVCSSDGNAFAFQASNGFTIYNIAEKNIKTINTNGDLIAISPKGQNILFRRESKQRIPGTHNLILSLELCLGIV